MALFPLTRRKTTVRVLPRFPARVAGDGGIAVAKESGTYTFSLDISSLNEISALENDDYFVVERADGTLARISFDNLVSAIAGALP